MSGWKLPMALWLSVVDPDPLCCEDKSFSMVRISTGLTRPTYEFQACRSASLGWLSGMRMLQVKSIPISVDARMKISEVICLVETGLVYRHSSEFFDFLAIDDQEYDDLGVFGGVLGQVGANFLF